MVDGAVDAGTSVFRDALMFFDKLGIYDVVLPFLLTFTIFFAILEKTKLFGTEKVTGAGGGEESTKKNLNAMVAFCGAFFVIASSKMVNIIQEGLSNVVLLLLISVSFLLLIGVFYRQDEAVALEGKWRNFMMILMFIAVILIFAHAIPTDSGEPWLNFAYNYVIDNYNSTAVSAIILAIVVIALMVWITRGEKSTKQEKSKS